MRILSFDVGIKNLALCLLERCENTPNKIQILKWDMINLCNDPKCDNCDKPAKYCNNGSHFCLKHAKASPNTLEIPNTKMIRAIQKMTVKELREHINTYINNDILGEGTGNIDKLLKKDLLKLIEDYNKAKYFDIVKSGNAGYVSLIDIGKTLREKLDYVLCLDNTNTNTSLTKIDKIVIENQLSSIAVRMKTLQGMITQYFIMRDYPNIEYINSSNKLKVSAIFEGQGQGQGQEVKYVPEKTSYRERKQAGILLCIRILEHYSLTEWSKWYKKAGGKKDDLADCFLQGIYCIV